MQKILIRTVVVLLYLVGGFGVIALAQKISAQVSPPVESRSNQFLYAPSADSGLGSIERIQQFQKLVDDKDYEINTSFRVPSINGGERLDREIRDKAQKLDENRFKIERTVRNVDTDGKLKTVEIVNEDHTKNGNVDEIQRATFRPDLNGRMQAQTVEQATITSLSKKEKLVEKSVYRLDVDGKLSLSEMEEGSERQVDGNTTVKETSRQAKDPNGAMSRIVTTKETTTKPDPTSLQKETIIQRADEAGRLAVAEKVLETQSESPDGTRKYQRLVESRNVPLRSRSVDSRQLILYQRVTGEEKRLSDGSIQNTIQTESLDPVNPSNGLRLNEIVTETARPTENGKVSVERVVKVRDVNGNYVVSQRMTQIVEPVH